MKKDHVKNVFLFSLSLELKNRVTVPLFSPTSERASDDDVGVM